MDANSNSIGDPIGTSYPKIATNFQSLYLAEIFVLLLWNLSWWLQLPSFRFSQIFIIFHRVVLEICDSSFLEFRKIRGPYWKSRSMRTHNIDAICIFWLSIFEFIMCDMARGQQSFCQNLLIKMSSSICLNRGDRFQHYLHRTSQKLSARASRRIVFFAQGSQGHQHAKYWIVAADARW